MDLKNAPVPDLKLDTFPVPLEARIEPWLEREAHSQFSVRRLEISKIYHLRTLESLKTIFLQLFRNHPEVSLECPWSRLPVPLEAKIELWLELGAKFIFFQEEAVFLKPENHPSVEQVLAATKSDATLANVPKT